MPEITQEHFSDRGSERMILSCLLRDPDLLIDVAVKLGEHDFLSSNHRTLFSVLQSLYLQGLKTFDLMAVVNEAAEKSVLNLIGGPDYIDALASNVVNPDNLGVYISKVAECSTKYRLYTETQFIQESILTNLGSGENNVSGTELLSRAEARLLDISMESRLTADAVDLGFGLADRLRALAEHPVDILGLPTPIPLLDKLINGLVPSTLTVVAARHKGGKSAFLMNTAAKIAYDLGVPVLYIDTEMGRNQMQTRVVAHMAQVPERAITNGTFIERDIYAANVWRACDIVESGRLYHQYTPGFTMDAVGSLVRKYHARYGIGAFFFDYIKMPESSGAESLKEYQILGNVTTELKNIAGRLSIPVVAAVQLKRGDTAAPKTRFREQDVADSDRIGHYCDTLLALGQKSRSEIEEDGMTCGTHRLQVLLARGGGANYHGIDIHCDFPTLTMRQAQHQSNPMQADI